MSHDARRYGEQGAAGRVGGVRVAVFASGTGSNFRRLYEMSQAGELGPGRVSLLLSDQPNSGAVAFAKEVGLPCFAETHKSLGGKEAWETQVLSRLRAEGVDLIVLAGYMRLIGHTLLSAFEGRMVNVHPSLLPAFRGLDAIGQAIAAGVTETGVTVHWIDAGLDSGPIIAQEKVPVMPEDTAETLAARIHAVEHVLLPQVVRLTCTLLAQV